MSDQYWTIRLGHPDEIDAVLRLVRALHGERYPELNRPYLQWRYAHNAQFRADIVMAEHQGQVIGIQPVALFDFRWNADRLKGAMYTGVLTHPEHRRRGVFRSLVTRANEYALRHGAHFSMTMPNAASLPGFQRFGEWNYPGPIPLYLKVVSGTALLHPGVGRAAAGLFGWLPRLIFSRRAAARPEMSLDVETVDRAPDELDEVAESFARECAGLGVLRSSAYWNWRYCSKPASGYRTFVARRSSKVVGAVVTSVRRRFGMDVGMILDLVATGGLHPIRELLHIAERDLVARRLSLITCQATSPLLRQALTGEGYVCPPARLLPKRFHYVYRLSGTTGVRRCPGEVSDWHLTFGDSDNT